MIKPVIIGGGISGLSAANQLLDNDIQPIIIEAGTIGQIKVCGEFFSFESISFLEKWEIPFLTFKKCNFNTVSKKYSFNFPNITASTSRSMCEMALTKRAIKLGATVYEKVSVEEIFIAKSKNEKHYLKLSNGQIIESTKLIVTTSRLPILKSKQFNPTFVGIKAHFSEVLDLPKELNMYFISGAYMGVTYIDENLINVCCLAKKDLFDKFQSPDLFMKYFISSHKKLNKMFDNSVMTNSSWLVAQIGQFGKKEIPNCPNTYFIGDAIASIFPAAGNGLAMGLTAGVMAANHIVSNSKSNFNEDWDTRYKKRLDYANFINSIFMSNYKRKIGFTLTKLFPNLFTIFYKKTRDNF